MTTKLLFSQTIFRLSLMIAFMGQTFAHISQNEGELFEHPLFNRQRLHIEELVKAEPKLVKKVTFADIAADSKPPTSLPKPVVKESNHQRMDSVDCVNAMGQILLSGWRVNGSFITQVANKVDELDEKYAGTQKYLDAALRKAEIIQLEATNFQKVAALRHAKHKKIQRRTILSGSVYSSR
jgi:hypothetical protein